MTAVGAIAILLGLGGSWLFRELLIRRLRAKHPQLFAELGAPSGMHLSSIVPRYQELQIRFWRFVWGGRALRLNDTAARVTAAALLASNILLAAGCALVLGSIWNEPPVADPPVQPGAKSAPASKP